MSQIDQSIPVAIVTGANRGIGLGLVRNILNNETPVNGLSDNAYVIATTRDIEASTDLLELQKANPRLHIIALDITKNDSITAFVDTFKQKGFTRIDVLINNAGVASKNDTLANLDVDTYNHIHHVNAVGPIHFTNALVDILNHTHELKGGKLEKPAITEASETSVDDLTHVRIQFITSRMGSISDTQSDYAPIYRSSKASLNMLAKCFAVKYPYLAVVVQHPGWVETRMGGAEAPLKVEESVAGCIKALNDHGYVSQTANKLWSYDGHGYDW